MRTATAPTNDVTTVKLAPKAGAAALPLSTVGDAEAELPEAELEEGVTELVLFEGTLEELGSPVADAVVEAVADSDGVDVVFVILDEEEKIASTVPTE